MEGLGYFIFLAFVVIFVVFAIYSTTGGNDSKKLRDTYYQALKENDKRAALNAGRAYYSSLRNGKSNTMYDELAISNDLSTMNTSTMNMESTS